MPVTKFDGQNHHNCHNKELVVNMPLFDKENPEENDIFVFSGYLEPKTHWVGIYDPILDKFFKKKDIIVFPREIDLEKITGKVSVSKQEELF